MARDVYRYTFPPEVSLEEVEASLLLAVWAVESLHGESQVRLDASHLIDSAKRACVIDAGTPVGRDLNRLFVGYIRREFADAFRVKHLAAVPKGEEVAA
jgi:hypothetical protein